MSRFVFHFRFAWTVFALATFSALPAAHAAVVLVNPGSGTLQTAINNAVTGDELELVDGTYSGASTVTNKDLTIRARAGTTPVLANNLTLQTGANRLVVQGVSFGTGTRVSANDAASTLILLQNTFNDAVVTCSGVRCIAIGNRFNPQGLLHPSGTHNVFGATGTTELIFAGNEMLATATFVLVCCYADQGYFEFRGATTHILGNHFRVDSIWSVASRPIRVVNGVATIAGNRFEFFLDRDFGNDVFIPRRIWIGNATATLRNNAFILKSASAIQTGSTGYRISSLRTIDIAAIGGTVRILNNVFDYRNVNFGVATVPTQGAIYSERFVQEISGNAFLGIGHAAVQLAAGTTANIADNACYQLLGACPPGATVTANPQFANAANGDYHLQAGSPAINAGPDSPYLLDIDGTRNDIGVHGGPFDLDQFDVQRNTSTAPYIYPLFDANKSIDGNGNLQIRLIGVARNQ